MQRPGRFHKSLWKFFWRLRRVGLVADRPWQSL